jgi:hypothetical protein
MDTALYEHDDGAVGDRKKWLRAEPDAPLPVAVLGVEGVEMAVGATDQYQTV